jgi:hypothetical protein
VMPGDVVPELGEWKFLTAIFGMMIGHIF